MQDNGIITAAPGRRRRIRSMVLLLAAGAASAVLILTAADGASAEPLEPSRPSHLGSPFSRRPARSSEEIAPARPGGGLPTAPPAAAPTPPAALPAGTAAAPAAPPGPPALLLPAVAATSDLPASLAEPLLPGAPAAPQPSDPAGPGAFFGAGGWTSRWPYARVAGWTPGAAYGDGWGGSYGGGAPLGSASMHLVAPHVAVIRLAGRHLSGRLATPRFGAGTWPEPVPAGDPDVPDPALPAWFAAPIPRVPSGPPDHELATVTPASPMRAGGPAHQVRADGAGADGTDPTTANGSRAPPPQEVH